MCHLFFTSVIYWKRQEVEASGIDHQRSKKRFTSFKPKTMYLYVCLWHRRSQTDGLISKRFHYLKANLIGVDDSYIFCYDVPPFGETYRSYV